MKDKSKLAFKDRRINSLQVAFETGEPVDVIEQSLLKLSELGYLRLIKTVDGVSTFAPTKLGALKVHEILSQKR